MDRALQKFVSLDGINRNDDLSWEVPSSRDPSKTYRVEEAFEGHFGCSCPDFLYRHSGSDSPSCKHILAVQVKQIAEARRDSEPHTHTHARGQTEKRERRELIVDSSRCVDTCGSDNRPLRGDLFTKSGGAT